MNPNRSYPQWQGSRKGSRQNKKTTSTNSNQTQSFQQAPRQQKPYDGRIETTQYQFDHRRKDEGQNSSSTTSRQYEQSHQQHSPQQYKTRSITSQSSQYSNASSTTY